MMQSPPHSASMPLRQKPVPIRPLLLLLSLPLLAGACRSLPGTAQPTAPHATLTDPMRPDSVHPSEELIYASIVSNRTYYHPPDAGHYDSYGKFKADLGKKITSIDPEKMKHAIRIVRDYLSRVTEHNTNLHVIAHRMLVDGDFALGVFGNKHAVDVLMGETIADEKGQLRFPQEKHPFQFLAKLAAAGIPAERKFEIYKSRIRLSIPEMLVRIGIPTNLPAEDLGWWLIARGIYLPVSLRESPEIKTQLEQAFIANFLNGHTTDGSGAYFSTGSCADAHLTEGLMVAVARFEGAEEYRMLIPKLLARHFDHLAYRLYEREAGLSREYFIGTVGHVLEVYGYAAKYGFPITLEEKNGLRYAAAEFLDVMLEHEAALASDDLGNTFPLGQISHAFHGIRLLQEAGIL